MAGIKTIEVTKMTSAHKYPKEALICTWTGRKIEFNREKNALRPPTILLQILYNHPCERKVLKLFKERVYDLTFARIVGNAKPSRLWFKTLTLIPRLGSTLNPQFASYTKIENRYLVPAKPLQETKGLYDSLIAFSKAKDLTSEIHRFLNKFLKLYDEKPMEILWILNQLQRSNHNLYRIICLNFKNYGIEY